MSDTTASTYMMFQIPIVSQDPGPQWATDVNACLTIIDAHTHSPGSGQQITPSGLNINADFDQQNNNLINIKTLRLKDQVSAITGSSPNLGCLYRVGAELFFNDGSGNQVQITTTGSVNAGAGSITGLPSGTASASFSAGTFTWASATNQFAVMNGGSFVIRETGTASPKGITLASPHLLAADYQLTMPTGLPGSTSALNVTSAGVMGTITYDSIGSSMTSTGANAISATRTRPTGTSVGAGGVAISSSSGAFSTTSASPVDITNLSVTITTSGRPVFIGLTNDLSAAPQISYLEASRSGQAAQANFRLLRDGTAIAEEELDIFSQAVASVIIQVPVGSIHFIDPIAAGTYTYKMQVFSGTSAITSRCYFAKLIAYEL